MFHSKQSTTDFMELPYFVLKIWFLLWGWLFLDLLTNWLFFFNNINRKEWWKVKELRKETVSRRTIHSFNKALLSTNHSLSPHCAEDTEVKKQSLPFRPHWCWEEKQVNRCHVAWTRRSMGNWHLIQSKSPEPFPEVWGPRKLVNLKE